MTDEDAPSEVAAEVNEMADELRDEPGFYQTTLRPVLHRIEIGLPVIAALGVIAYLRLTDVQVGVPGKHLHFTAAVLLVGLVGTLLMAWSRDEDQSYVEGPGSMLDLDEDD